jgi:hypothetical protein
MRACLDEGCQRGKRGERVEVDVLGRDIDAIPVRDLAQQQRAGQRVKADARAEQRRIGGRLSQLRAARDIGEDLAQLIEDQDEASCPAVGLACHESSGLSRPVSPSGSSGSDPVSDLRYTTSWPSAAGMRLFPWAASVLPDPGFPAPAAPAAAASVSA